MATSPAAISKRHTAGLHFVKLDLHLHTPGSKDFGDRAVTAEDIVEKAIAAGLGGIGVTDHNSAAWVDAVKTAASHAITDLVVFPGCEITCMGGKYGIHILAIFDPACSRADVEGLLAELQLQPSDYGQSETIVQKDPITVVQTIRRRGGLAILAHANSSKGALADMSGQQRTKLIQLSDLTAVEATDFRNADLQERQKRAIDLLDGNDPVYQRTLAVYQGSDNPAGDGGHGLDGIGTRCSYFKMDRINLEGLRQCFADADVRIRQDFEFTTVQYPRIKSVRISGGFFDGTEAVFHEGLNSIVGAKGAGKSLLVEFIRFALDQPPLNAEILQDHEDKLQSRLQQYGTVEVIVCDETGTDVVVKRVYNPIEDNPYDPPTRYDVGQFFPVLFLSQNEIIKIAEHPDEQITFIDRFFDFRSFQREIEQAESELRELDAQLGDGYRAYRDVTEMEKLLKEAAGELERLEAALKNPAFDEYSKLDTKSRGFNDHMSYVKDLRQKITNITKEVSLLALPASRAGVEMIQPCGG